MIDHYKYPTIVVGENYTLSVEEMMEVYMAMRAHFEEEDVAGWLEHVAGSLFCPAKFGKSDAELAWEIYNSEDKFEKFIYHYEKSTDWTDDGFEEDMLYAFKQMQAE